MMLHLVVLCRHQVHSFLGRADPRTYSMLASINFANEMKNAYLCKFFIVFKHTHTLL